METDSTLLQCGSLMVLLGVVLPGHRMIARNILAKKRHEDARAVRIPYGVTGGAHEHDTDAFDRQVLDIFIADANKLVADADKGCSCTLCCCARHDFAYADSPLQHKAHEASHCAQTKQSRPGTRTLSRTRRWTQHTHLRTRRRKAEVDVRG